MKMRRLLAPEIVQTSAMDCGPACLTALLQGFGVPVSYDRIRETCQTDLDGTSIDTIEQIAVEMGLEAEQIMVPTDHLLLQEAHTLPGLIVARLPNAMTHFMILWRRHGKLLQAMDPAEGRQWLGFKEFAGKIHVHAQAVPAADWREWAGSGEFLGALHQRASRLGLSKSTISRVTAAALADPGWRSIAALDAAVRMLTPMVAFGGLRGAGAVDRILEQFLEEAGLGFESAFQVIPPAYWCVLPARDSEESEEHIVFRGAVVLRVKGRRPQPSRAAEAVPASASPRVELLQALGKSPVSAMRRLFRLLKEDGLFTPLLLCGTLVVAAGGVVFEAVLYRTFLNITSTLGLSEQRLSAVLMLLGFIAALLALDWLNGAGLLRSGRKLEARLRAYIQFAIPRLPDRYFGSRLISDMAERSHAIHEIRGVPLLGGYLLYQTCQLAVTTACIIFLDPRDALLAVCCSLFAIALPLALQPLLAERDLRFRTHAGGLCRFYFDALRGLMPVRAHGAEDAIRTEHESLLSTWMQAGLGLQRAVVFLEAAGLSVSLVLVAWLVIADLTRSADTAQALLLVYWALNIPVLGAQIAQLARRYPKERNLALRVLEPLRAPQTEDPAKAPAAECTEDGATCRLEQSVYIRFEEVSVRAIGQTILEPFDLKIQRGCHVCIVGRSGAGKSTLLGLLLGFHEPSGGRVLVDGVPLEREHLETLRRRTAWVDPNVQIWNRSLVENLRYGLEDDGSARSVGAVIDEANLVSLLEKLPEGSQTRLGESGALISGGEGQRVRFGRAIMRPDAGLVLLDEPFTALDREQRHRLLVRARSIWKQATLLCATHDIRESLHFERVLVLEQGKIVEDGKPYELLAQSGSHYRTLLEAEIAAGVRVWSNPEWRSLRIEEGCLLEGRIAHEHEQQFAEDLLASPASGRGPRSLRPQGQAPADIH